MRMLVIDERLAVITFRAVWKSREIRDCGAVSGLPENIWPK